MTFDELFKALLETFKAPETLEEAIDYVKKDPGCQLTIEELAFKQVVVNILVAAGIVSEKDFNDSVRHFKESLTRGFAEKLLATCQGIDNNKNGFWIKVDPAPEQKANHDDEPDDWEDEPLDNNKHYDA